MLRTGFLALVFCVAGCQSSAVLPNGWALGDAAAESLAGRRAAPALEERYGGVVRDATSASRLAGVADRLASRARMPSGEWRVHLLDSRRVNAFSLPGNLLYVTRGLLDRIGKDDALLAAALAHEMAHVAAKDSLKAAPADTGGAVAREIQADRVGARYLRESGFDPGAMARLIHLVRDCQSGDMANTRLAALGEIGTR